MRFFFLNLSYQRLFYVLVKWTLLESFSRIESKYFPFFRHVNKDRGVLFLIRSLAPTKLSGEKNIYSKIHRKEESEEKVGKK